MKGISAFLEVREVGLWRRMRVERGRAAHLRFVDFRGVLTLSLAPGCFNSSALSYLTFCSPRFLITWARPCSREFGKVMEDEGILHPIYTCAKNHSLSV
jgi:hypothetical protein